MLKVDNIIPLWRVVIPNRLVVLCGRRGGILEKLALEFCAALGR